MTEINQNSQSCGSECGCRVSSFPTSRKCPSCGERLSLTGLMQRMEFRLACNSCGYRSPLLKQEEVSDLL